MTFACKQAAKRSEKPQNHRDVFLHNFCFTKSSLIISLFFQLQCFNHMTVI